MLKVVSAIRAHRFLTLLAVALGCVVGGGALGLSRKSEHQQPIQPSNELTVMSKTPGLQVLASEKTTLGNNTILAIRLQNVSGKDIKALTISIGKSWVTRSYFLSEESIASGSISDLRIPLSSEAAQEITPSSQSHQVTLTSVAAVFFADNTAEGDPPFARMLADQRAGISDQAKRILPKLRRLSNGPGQEASLADLESEILALPTKGNGQSSPAYNDGLDTARTTLLNRLGEIKEKRHSQQIEQAATRQEKLKRVFESLASSPSN